MAPRLIRGGEYLHVAFAGGECSIPFRPGVTIREILDTTTLRVRSSCGGVGACGQCLVRIEQGEVNPPTVTEVNRLGSERIEQGSRLACQVRPLREVRISIDAVAPLSGWRSLSETEYLSCAYSGDAGAMPARSGYGAAIDLGTTQIRVSVLELATGKRIAGRCGLNPQGAFGADVLSRVMAACESEGRAREIGGVAREAIGEALLDIGLREDVPLGEITQLAIVGNTAMCCLLVEKNYDLLLLPDNWMRGVDCRPAETRQWCAAWGLAAGAAVEVVQPLAGFVGSDLLAGVRATGLTDGPPGSLLIDFGTNSEMALWDGSVAWVSSAAGGPAFEGCGISCGMPAEPGAICQAALADDSAFVLGVLGGGEAKGLCGSGLVDVIAGLLRTGQLKHNGRFTREIGDTGVLLSKDHGGITLKNRDIDALQRAKAAIGAGVQCLLGQAGMGIGDLRRICVCGAFGRQLDIGNAQEIGLLPAVPAERIELCGNTALAGCERLLLSADGPAVLEALKKKCRIINLSLVENFEELFIENLYLKPIPRQ